MNIYPHQILILLSEVFSLCSCLVAPGWQKKGLGLSHLRQVKGGLFQTVMKSLL